MVLTLVMVLLDLDSRRGIANEAAKEPVSNPGQEQNTLLHSGKIVPQDVDHSDCTANHTRDDPPYDPVMDSNSDMHNSYPVFFETRRKRYTILLSRHDLHRRWLIMLLPAGVASAAPKTRLAEIQNIEPKSYWADLTLDPEKITFPGAIVPGGDCRAETISWA